MGFPREAASMWQDVCSEMSTLEAHEMECRRISCEVRCLERSTVEAAKKEMKGAAVGSVPFMCKLSGKREDILLLSDESARHLASMPNAIGGALTQKVLYAILGAELCECDIATLTESDEGRVLDELERLRSAGFVKRRKIDGMNYFALANLDLENKLATGLAEVR